MTLFTFPGRAGVMMKSWFPGQAAGWLLLVLFAGCLMAMPAAARDVRLGGQTTGPNQVLPPDTVKLPTIDAAIRRDDGGWHHVTIDAWLAAGDPVTAKRLEELKTAIADKVKEVIPEQPFEQLRSAHGGSTYAKKIISQATEQSLGHPWQGDVLIRELLAY